MSDLDEINRSLGQLEGKIDSILTEQKRQSKRDDMLDKRLRNTEITGARNGAIGGGLITIAITLIKETSKNWMG